MLLIHIVGTATDDTVCVSCPTGTFQDQNNLELQCKNCSTCSTPSAETQACTAQTDTECGSKSDSGGKWPSQTERQTSIVGVNDLDRQADRQTDGQTDRQMDKWPTGRQTDNVGILVALS